MPTIHVLNGDCLAEELMQSGLNKDFVVCRECLITGEVNAGRLQDFWELRAQFVAGAYDATTEEYYNKTVTEFEKLKNLPDGCQVCLWFENDLFCQVNMWFVIYLLSGYQNIKIFRVFPFIENEIHKWKGFGAAGATSLEKAFDNKVVFTPNDVLLGKQLWTAYQNSDFEKLRHLAKVSSTCFQFLPEVIEAHIARFPASGGAGRPERVVRNIIETKSNIFHEVFAEFSLREGIYGFGDVQIKGIFDKII